MPATTTGDTDDRHALDWLLPGRHAMIGAPEIRTAMPHAPVGKRSTRTLIDEEAALRAGKP